MTTELRTELNEAQKIIYTRTNIRRAYSDFDDSDIAGIYLRDTACLVVRRDGSEQTYDRTLIKKAFTEYTCRLKDFFSYLGPDYRGPSVWRYNSYVLFKGWYYSHALGHLNPYAQLQSHWADKFIHLDSQAKIEALLQSDQTDLGHLVAPDGFIHPPSLVQDEPQDGEDFNDCSLQATEDSASASVDSHQKVQAEPYCSCGSFKRQLNNLSEFQQEIEGFKPWCIHLTWVRKYREFLSRRTEVREQSRGQLAEKAAAWWYAPPEGKQVNGRFLVLYTTAGSMAPVTQWRTYKPKELFTQHDAWRLFDNMMDNGFVPFCGPSLPQLVKAWKKPQQ